MTNIEFITAETWDGKIVESVLIYHDENDYTAMSKADYEAMLERQASEYVSSDS